MEPDKELQRTIKNRLDAAGFIRWVRSRMRDEGKDGGPPVGWEKAALSEALALLAAQNGLDPR